MEQNSFLDAVELHRDMVFRIALHQCGNPHDADDAVQEGFLRLYGEKKPFEGPEHLRRWLIRVTINLCRDMLRSPWRRRRVSLDALPPAFETPEQESLYQSVMALPEKYRTVLDLFYYEGFSVQEIAELLHVSVTSVTTRLSRARKLLKQQLTEV